MTTLLVIGIIVVLYIGLPFPEQVLSGFLIGTTFPLAIHEKYRLDN